MSHTPYDDFVDAIANLVDHYEPNFSPGDHRDLEDAMKKDADYDPFFLCWKLDDVARDAVRDTLIHVLTHMDDWRKSGLLEVSWRSEQLPVKPHGKSLGRDVVARQDRCRSIVRRCPLHLKPLKRGSAIIAWGYFLSPPESYRRAKRNLFPMARPLYSGGCEVWDGMPSRHAVRYCPDCRAALYQWLLTHKPSIWLGLDGWDKIRRAYRRYDGVSKGPSGR